MKVKKMKKCKVCGAEIAKNAKVCPNCGAKNRINPFLVIVIFFAVILLIGALASNGKSEPQKVGTVEPQETEDTKDISPSVFHVGDVVELDNVNVTLVNVSENSGSEFLAPSDGNVFVVFEFYIDNQSEDEIAVSSLVSFEAYFDDFASTISVSAIANSGEAQLDGSIAPGKKMSGIVGYEAPSDWSKAEIRFTPDFWSGKEIIFEYEK